MCEVYDLPAFMTLPRNLCSVDKVERHYLRMKNRLDFLIEQDCCTREQYDEWLRLLDTWLTRAVVKTQWGERND